MGNSLSLAAYTALRRGRKKGDVYHYPDRPEGPLVWIHLPDPERAKNICDMLRRLHDLDEGLHFIMTVDCEIDNTSWLTVVQPPVDNSADAKAFLTHWKPDVLLWLHGALMRVLLAETDGLGIPRFLIAAEAHAFEDRKLRWFPDMSKSLLQRFDRILCTDEKSRTKLRKFGVKPWAMERSGPIEEGAPALQCNEAERDDVAALLAGRAVWLSVSMTPYEIKMIADAHKKASRFSHRLLLIVVPKKMTDGPVIAEQFREAGFSTGLRSANDETTETTQVYIADTEDELGMWYRLAPITFMGGTFDQGGGRPPFEPAALGSAIVHGPQVDPYALAYARLHKANACKRMDTAENLATEIEALLSPDKTALLAQAAWLVTSSGAEVTDRIGSLLMGALDR
jgi:3-deoxy-D-manno-octulosonic-acid transferase